MVVGICRLSLMLPESQSLKEKRAVLRRVKDRARQKFHVAIAEVGGNDAWQSALIGFAVVANERRFVEAVVDRVVGFIDTMAKVAEEEKDFVQYGDEPISTEGYSHWEPEEASPPQNKTDRPKAPKLKEEPFPWETGEDDEGR